MDLDTSGDSSVDHLTRLEKQQRHARSVARRAEKQRRIQRRRRRNRKSFKSTRFVPPAPIRLPFVQPQPLPNISVPEELDFLTQPDATLGFFHELRTTIAKYNHLGVLIDHAGLHKMSPEAALVLIAELFKCDQEFPRCRKQCLLPDDATIKNLLGQAGYYKYFRKAKWEKPATLTTHFLEHERGTQVEGEIVGKIIELFQPVAHLDDDRTASLYKAVGECMNNVLEHAYPKAQTNPEAYRFWWLLAYSDVAKSTISFCFYDQGEGIPRTIRSRLVDQLPLFARSGSELIERAVVKGGYSRSGRKSKGRGLPALRDFIDTAADGELVIFSQKSRVIFHTQRKPHGAEFSLPLPGSLITWNIRIGGPSANENN